MAQPIISRALTTTGNLPESFPNHSSAAVTWQTLLSFPRTPSSHISAGIAVCPSSGGNLPLHRHAQAEMYYILSGSGVVTINGVEKTISEGDLVFLPGNAEHGVKNKGQEELRWLYVFPTGSFEDVHYCFS